MSEQRAVTVTIVENKNHESLQSTSLIPTVPVEHNTIFAYFPIPAGNSAKNQHPLLAAPRHTARSSSFVLAAGRVGRVLISFLRSSPKNCVERFNINIRYYQIVELLVVFVLCCCCERVTIYYYYFYVLDQNNTKYTYKHNIINMYNNRKAITINTPINILKVQH